MNKIVFLCLIALSVNAVLIQTVLPEDFILKNLVRVGILFILFLCLLLKNQKVLIASFFGIILSAILLLTRDNPDQLTYIFIFVIAQAFLMIKEQKLEKYLMLSSFMSLGLIFLFLATNITQNEIKDFRNRMTFGVESIPFFYNVVYGTFALLIIYSRKYMKRLKWLITLISLLATTYFFIKTDLRGGYYSFLILIILLKIVPVIGKIKLIKYITAITPIIFLGFSFFLASLHDNVIANLELSLRPQFIYNFYQNIDFIDILFSTSVKQLDTVNIVDNSYIHLLVGGGLLLTLYVWYMFYKSIINLFNHKLYTEISFIIATCFYFNTESIMLRLENLFVLYFWYLIFRYSQNHQIVETVLKKIHPLNLINIRNKKVSDNLSSGN